MQFYIDHMVKKYRLNDTEFLMTFDELYNEPNDGQIIIRRNPLNLKFEFFTFIDLTNTHKDKKQQALKNAS